MLPPPSLDAEWMDWEYGSVEKLWIWMCNFSNWNCHRPYHCKYLLIDAFFLKRQEGQPRLDMRDLVKTLRPYTSQIWSMDSGKLRFPTDVVLNSVFLVPSPRLQVLSWEPIPLSAPGSTICLLPSCVAQKLLCKSSNCNLKRLDL